MVTYKDAGVDIDAGNEAVKRITSQVERTHRFAHGKVLSGIGGFGAIVESPDGSCTGYSTDGVGTKLLLAILLGRHDTVGIDLVAMCANDLVATGLTPDIFLDYIAMDTQDKERTEAIVSGIVKGCQQAETALVGGEMAELPDMYLPGHYDLAGFAVGRADSKESLILGDAIQEGMYIYGLHSSGIHSNGFSLVRPAFLLRQNERARTLRRLERFYPELGCTLGEELLKPTRIYVKAVKKLREKYTISGIVHITGGGLVENPPRVFPKGLSPCINLNVWEPPAIFRLIQEKGRVPASEMLRTFNLGMGLLIISPDEIKESGVQKIGMAMPNNKDFKLASPPTEPHFQVKAAKGSGTMFTGGEHLLL